MPDGDLGSGPEVAADRLPADAPFHLDMPERPRELAEGEDLLLFEGCKTWLMPMCASQCGVPPATPQLASLGGRGSDVHWWPDSGVHRDWGR
jgi:hypothetical protein